MKLNGFGSLAALIGLLAGCDSGGGGTASDGEAACARFSATYARCLAAACPNAEPFTAQFAAEIETGCLLVKDNEVLSQVYRTYADGTCDDVYFSASIDQDIHQESQADNNRVVFCASGPIAAPEVCTARCTTVTGCLASSSPYALIYGEQDVCEAACIGRPKASAQIACLAETGCVSADCTP